MLIKVPRRQVHITLYDVLESLKLLFIGESKKGAEIKKFERALARYLGCKYVVSTYSGKQALYIILKSLDLKEGDEILVPSYTASSVPATIVRVGFKPIFVDVDPQTFNINPKLVKEKINKKTRAIIATHIHGLPCDIETLSRICDKYKLFLIEDCAHALGAEYKGKKIGTFGRASFFSFGMGKHLPTLGGGAIVSDNYKIIKKARDMMKDLEFPGNFELFFKLVKTIFLSLSTNPIIFSLTVYPFLCIFGDEFVTKIFETKIPLYGELPKEYKKRFSNMQALLALRQVKSLDINLSKRIKNALILKEQLGNLKDIKLQEYPDFIKHSYLDFAVLVKKREKVIKNLLKNGIDVQKTWLDNCSVLDDFKSNNILTPISGKLSRGVIYLPVDSHFDEKTVLRISKIVKSVLAIK